MSLDFSGSFFAQSASKAICRTRNNLFSPVMMFFLAQNVCQKDNGEKGRNACKEYY